MQRRRLGEIEFSGIKRHPGIGAEIVANDPDLCLYKDIIYGHHKFYDGTFGYPINFDNTKSKQRKVIDIITIADCLDATTDNYSRNYKISKKLDELIQEFVETSGTRYNPELVNLIVSSEELQGKLELIVEDERLQLMYDAYSAGRENIFYNLKCNKMRQII